MKWNWAHKTKFRIHNSDIQRKCIKLCKENILKIQIIYKNNGKNTGRNSIYSYFRWKNFRKEISIGKTKKVQKNMRIWKINPKLMCRKHLLGEHVESHMFVGSINKRRSIQGHIEKGQVEIHNLK